MENPNNPKQLYNLAERGSAPPDYTPKEAIYRSTILNALQLAYTVREQPHMELNDMTFSEYYLINRQLDMAYNPPKRNASDSRVATGVTHEKDSTILSILTALNLQPKVRIFDGEDNELKDAGTVLTARLKKSLLKDNFRDKEPLILRTNIAQGNVYVEERRDIRWQAKKVPTTKTSDPTKLKWKTILEKQDNGCTSILLPNTAVFLTNLLENDIHKQQRIFVVMHVPVEEVAQTFKDFPRWKNIPKFGSQTVPTNVDGVWGDYWLQQPVQDYVEVIMYQSEIFNEYQIFLNGVMMFPVSEENGIVTGYPLTEFSPSGKYTVVKGDNEPIPFFAIGKSTPAKTQVKEETLNELLRLMIYKMRQAAKPPIGNNSDKILQSNIWDAGTITPDIKDSDLSVLTPNAGITGADFSFYQLIQQSISESSVSASVEGTNVQGGLTATQYLDQKRENLKKLGLAIDNTISFLRDLYWLRLYNEIQYLDKKEKRYSEADQKFVEAYSSFSVEDDIAGSKGILKVNLVDDNAGRAGDQYMQSLMNEEENSPTPMRVMNVRPDYLMNLVKNLPNKIYIDVIPEPEGSEQNQLTALFGSLIQYANLRAGDTSAIDFEYLEQIIGDNSGFEADKIFKKVAPPQPPMPGMPGQPPPPGAVGPGGGSPPKPSFVPTTKPRQAPNSTLAQP
jgi:hypothetical protein